MIGEILDHLNYRGFSLVEVMKISSVCLFIQGRKVLQVKSKPLQEIQDRKERKVYQETQVLKVRRVHLLQSYVLSFC